ncbi:MAG: archaellin/type IV pilin N-terminal domain-containing protein [Candidatus Pacearchaeota archaeon]
MKNNKRGVSQVVATVLIILTTISAVAILYAFVVPFVKNSLTRSTECMPYQEFYTFDELGYNCYNSTLYALSIKTKFDKSLANNTEGLKIVLTERGGLNKIIDIRNGMQSSSEEGGVWILNNANDKLRIAGAGGVITYVYHALEGEEFITAEVYPVLKSGRICADVKEEIKLVSCSSDKIIR